MIEINVSKYSPKEGIESVFALDRNKIFYGNFPSVDLFLVVPYAFPNSPWKKIHLAL